MYNVGRLPKPLSTEEEQYLAEVYQSLGELWARDKLIKHNLRFALAEARATAKRKGWQLLQDLEDLTTDACFDAVETFKPKGIRFISYLTQALDWKFAAYFNKKKIENQRVTQYLGEPIHIHDKSPQSMQPWSDLTPGDISLRYLWEDVTPGPRNTAEALLEDEEKRGVVQDALNFVGETYGPRSKKILEMYYLHDASLDKIGSHFKLDGVRIKILKEKALRLLRHKGSTINYQLQQACEEQE